jgi:sugar (pentulose or hexulose) kinase
VFEAIAFALRSNIEVFQQSGLRIRELRSFGGGARNRFWNQIKADVSGLPVATSRCSEPGCMGAAILAGVGAGVFPDVATACRRLVALDRMQYPEPTAVKEYERFYRDYQDLERHMTPWFDRTESRR